jgi:hypothetical protein
MTHCGAVVGQGSAVKPQGTGGRCSRRVLVGAEFGECGRRNRAGVAPELEQDRKSSKTAPTAGFVFHASDGPTL